MKILATLLLTLSLCLAASSPQAEPAALQPFAVPDEAQSEAAARVVVEAFHEVLLDCMKQADALGFRGRYERIAAALDERFDVPFMARLSVGAAWKELAPQQRTDFVDLSHQLSASSYAHNFDGYADQNFETRSSAPGARGTMVVKTEFVQPGDSDVKFDYRLRWAGDRWRIIDVHLDGRISEITLRRAQFRSLIEREGFPELVRTVEERIEELSEG